jgi:transcription antitermination factor NusG
VAEASYWACAMTQPAQEQRALRNLRRQGYEAFYPFYLSTTKKLKQTVVRPVFASYVFVRILEDYPWASINGTYGVSRLLTRPVKDSDTRLPQRVPEDFMNSLTRYLRSSNSVLGPEFTVNTRVRILCGVLQNHEAIVKWSNAERAGLLFQILNREVEIEFSVEEIARLPDETGYNSMEGHNAGNLWAT